ncbi:hypothetical protein HOG17_01760 [Candidatus Peregrinibacteria bacterium]|jgi:hypothetical protein|nr:hypothetical protein [Candidatus Peregrinibacteria bacterium]MBT4148084.1 hypothetical protein [Candidatus Peregrinibacteria bacterium]MBT4365848.1 hypothetical protein [Candidatus Peregrinibacteria bacterium]MBT4456462.1 hypothetical protein [Candidatus Peregrinibacteria bacterium]
MSLNKKPSRPIGSCLPPMIRPKEPYDDGSRGKLEDPKVVAVAKEAGDRIREMVELEEDLHGQG